MVRLPSPNLVLIIFSREMETAVMANNKKNERIISEKDIERIYDNVGLIVQKLNSVVADYVDNDDVENVAAVEACVIHGMLIALSCVDDVRNGMSIDEVTDVVAAFAASSAIRMYGPDKPFGDNEFFESVFMAMKKTAGLLRSDVFKELFEADDNIVEIGIDELPDWLVDEVCKTSGMSKEELTSRTRIGIPASIKDEFMSAIASGEVSPEDVGVIFAGAVASSDGKHDDPKEDSPEEMLRKFRDGVS